MDGKTLRLSNLSKPLYPRDGFTKADMLRYYLRIAPMMLAHLRGRPVTLKRYPDGVEGEAFYEKRCPSHRPDWVPTALVQLAGHTSIRFCEIDDPPTLAWVANLAAIELHVSTSRTEDAATPTSVVFDLDPGAPAGILDAAKIALVLRDTLAGLRLRCWIKTSGGKGLHLFVPLNTKATYEQTKTFARLLAEAFERRSPDEVVSRQMKTLRKGKVLIDWSQNDPSKTMVCAYSMRATARPSVSTPLRWEEIEAAVRKQDAEALHFTPEQVLARVSRYGDLFAPVQSRRQELPPARKSTSRTVKGNDGAEPGKGAKRVVKKEADELETYRRKRDFARTGEPEGGGSRGRARRRDPIFVVQKHDATALHYDFRLEIEDALWSWAVPKGPSLDPAVKRLAMPTEPHPMEYADFEGVIPEGEYGAGPVIVWDMGTYQNVRAQKSRPLTMPESLEDGLIEVALSGEKLNGIFALVRTASAGGGRERWLLVKKKDAHADPSVDLVAERPESVKTGRIIEELGAKKRPRKRSR